MTILTWDGSHLGYFDHHSLHWVHQDYWQLYHKGSWSLVILKPAKDCLACALDELKPLFHLQKIGTHSLRYSRRSTDNCLLNQPAKKLANGTYIVYRPSLNGNQLILDQPLGELDQKQLNQLLTNPQLKREIQRTLIFQLMFSTSVVYLSKLALRTDPHGDQLQVICLHERYTSAYPKMENRIYRDFIPMDLSSIVKAWLVRDELVEVLPYYRREMRKVFLRVHSDGILMVDLALAWLQNACL